MKSSYQNYLDAVKELLPNISDIDSRHKLYEIGHTLYMAGFIEGQQAAAKVYNPIATVEAKDNLIIVTPIENKKAS